MTVASLRYANARLQILQHSHLAEPMKQFALREAEKRGWIDKPYSGYESQDVNLVLDHFRSSNAIFSDKHWKMKWDDVFKAENTSTLQYNEMSYEDCSPDAANEIMDFYRVFSAHLKEIDRTSIV